MKRISLYLPLRIQSVANLREHWRVRHRRGHQEKLIVAAKLRPLVKAAPVAFPVKVTLTRIAPRLLDSDNCWGGFKAIRDEIAKVLGLDDGHKSYTWDVQQERGKPREYGCRIDIEGAA